jgi:hypothetical protein
MPSTCGTSPKVSSETDPNKLHTLKGELDQYQVYSPEQIDSLVELYPGGADRDQLDPILDACVADYVTDLDEDGQVDFKGKAIIHSSDYQSVDEANGAIDRYFRERNEHFRRHPKRAGKKIWGKEPTPSEFSAANNCKDPQWGREK